MLSMNDRGSVLIASIWVMSIFSVFTASLAFEGSQHAVLMRREIDQLETKSDFVSGVYLAHQMVLNDAQPYEDSRQDEWLGKLALPEAWKNRISVEVEDEESKLNLNSASEAFLEEFLKCYEEKNHPLKTGRKKFIQQIVKQRKKDRINSYEELYFLEDVEKEDVQKLKPFLTVYSEYPQININTASPMVLEALIKSLPGDDFAKGDLFQKIEEFLGRKDGVVYPAFLSHDLEPNPFLEKLMLRNSPQMMQLANQLLPLVTSDSQIFYLTIKTKKARQAEAVIKADEKYKVEVLNWHEY